MGRPSKLTESQLEEIKRRITAGEGVRALAAEFGVSPALVSKLCSPKAKRIKAVANQVFEADKALARLPVSERPLALRIVDDMKHTAANLARGARAASETFADLAEMARERKGKVRQADGSIDFKMAAEADMLGQAANRAAVPALRLVAAGQTAPVDEDPEDEPDMSTLSDAELDQLIALQEKAGA